MTLVLFIPGLISDGYVWAAARSALGTHRSAVADVTTQTTIPEMAQDLLRQFPGPLIVVGHSMGGRVAMEMARQSPDRIAGLALLNTGLHPRKEGEAEKRQAMIDLAHDRGMLALAQVWLPGMMATGLPADPEVLAGLTAMVARMTPEIHERQMRALLARPDASQTIGTYRGPMLLLTGRQDAWSPVAQHEEIARLCPQARLEVIHNSGHFAPVEQADRVADALAPWAIPLLSLESR